jgi:hypothetical protein
LKARNSLRWGNADIRKPPLRPSEARGSKYVPVDEKFNKELYVKENPQIKQPTGAG